MPLSIAIVGAGPSGFYAAAALLKAAADCRIDMIEALPTPYGLVRSGVAPDHQSTKNVTRAFKRTALTPGLRYYGNIRIGRDVALAELREFYDAVVLAVGAPRDRDLGIPGADKTGVYGAAAFVGWYNADPCHRDLAPVLDGKGVAVIGNGNVAIDVARVLVKTPREMARSDLPDYAATAIRDAGISDVYLIGRRGPVEAKFTNKELGEMGRLEACRPQVDPADLPDAVEDGLSDRDRRQKQKNLETLRSFVAAGAEPARRRVHFVFFARPVEVLGGSRVDGLRLERTRLDEAGRAVGTGAFFDVACGTVISAIGYRMVENEGLPYDPETGVIANADGRVEVGLYVVGWAKRGPTGVIGTNKADGDAVARQVVADLDGGGKPGRAALERRLRERGLRWVSFEDWQIIEAAEKAAAPPGAPRRKFCRIEDMLSLLNREKGDVGLTKT